MVTAQMKILARLQVVLQLLKVASNLTQSFTALRRYWSAMSELLNYFCIHFSFAILECKNECVLETLGDDQEAKSCVQITVFFKIASNVGRSRCASRSFHYSDGIIR